MSVLWEKAVVSLDHRSLACFDDDKLINTLHCAAVIPESYKEERIVAGWV